jgi:hypothetical protein
MTLPDPSGSDHAYQASGFLEPFTALPSNLLGRVNPYELAVLWALQHRGSEIRPSLKRLAEDAGMGLTKLKETLASLKEKGLLSWTHRFDGEVQLPSLFRLHIWAHLPGSPHDPPQSPHDSPPVATRPTPGRHATTNKINTTRSIQLEKTPLPPMEGEEGRALPAQPVLVLCDTPVAKTGSKAKAKPEPIPTEFVHLEELINHWLERRKANGHKLTPWGARSLSVKALRLAVAKGVAEPYLEAAADAGWKSLGHAGHKEQIDRLAAPSGAFSGAPRYRSQSHNPEPPALKPYVRSY